MIFLSAIMEVNRLFGSLNRGLLSHRLRRGRSSTRSVLWPFYLHHRNGCFRILEQKDERSFVLSYMWQRNGTAVLLCQNLCCIVRKTGLDPLISPKF